MKKVLNKMYFFFKRDVVFKKTKFWLVFIKLSFSKFVLRYMHNNIKKVDVISSQILTVPVRAHKWTG